MHYPVLRRIDPDVVPLVIFGRLHRVEVRPCLSLSSPLAYAFLSQDICDNFQKQVRRGILCDPSVYEICTVLCLRFPPAPNAQPPPPDPTRHFQLLPRCSTSQVQGRPLRVRYRVW